MKKWIPLVATLVVGILLGAVLFRGGGESVHDQTAMEAGKGDASPAAVVWTCSMHPQVRAPKKGLCPICAMALIPLSDLGSVGTGRTYSLSESAKILAGIQTTKVIRRFPEAGIRLYGTVEYGETNQKTIAARFPGRIERLFVDYDGILVKKGDHLATIYSPDLLAAQTELLTAKRFNNADALRIARDKLSLWGFPDTRIAEIEASGKAADSLTIDAPVSGIVTEKNVREGDYVTTGMSLFRINDPAQLWVVFNAYESDKPWLRFGQTVSFEAEALPGKVFESRISFLSPELEMKTRTFPVRVNVENPDGLLKPGMFVRAKVSATVAGFGRVIDPSLAGKWISPMHPEIVKDGPGKCDICGMDLVKAEDLGYTAVAPTGEPPLIVPISAVMNTGKRSLVYVEKPGEKEPTYEGREVLLGPRADGFYLVEAGLKENEAVVTEGSFAIDSALQIQARPSMMLPGEDDAPLFKRLTVGEGVLPVIDQIVGKYFAVQLALAGDDLGKTKAAAKAMNEALSAVIPEFDPEGSAVYVELKNRLSDSLATLDQAADLEAARVPFEPLSAAIDELVRRFGTGEVAVFSAHCPMAFDNRGADWLQGDEQLLNPYFGAAMLKCGSVEEQIAGEVKAEVKSTAKPGEAKP